MRAHVMVVNWSVAQLSNRIFYLRLEPERKLSPNFLKQIYFDRTPITLLWAPREAGVMYWCAQIITTCDTSPVLGPWPYLLYRWGWAAAGKGGSTNNCTNPGNRRQRCTSAASRWPRHSAVNLQVMALLVHTRWKAASNCIRRVRIHLALPRVIHSDTAS